MLSQRIRNGSALLLSIVILATLSAWAVFICSVSGSNVQIAENQRKGDGARASAESGLEITRFWLNRFNVSGTTDASQLFGILGASLSSDLTNNSINNIVPAFSGSQIAIPSVILDSTDGRSFTAMITQVDASTLQVDVTGHYGGISRTIRVNYVFGERTQLVFDYGVATKGALHLAGNIELEGININVESSVFIESENTNLALSMSGNSSIAGDVRIGNPLATVDLQGGQASIGGERGEAAMDHVIIGADPPEFPVPNPDHFAGYVTNVVDASTDTTTDATYENIRIAAGTNPVFTSDITLKGVVYIETPNVVTFAGNVNICGVIVGDGELSDNSCTNQINLLGTVSSASMSELPAEEQFSGIRNEMGTFVLAPGFHVGFGGNFSTLSGAIAANGIEFFGNAGGTINGTVVNYSDQTMPLAGNSNLQFNRSGTVKIPAGFIPDIVVNYDPSSYSEVMI